jgi:hypothetical protein
VIIEKFYTSLPQNLWLKKDSQGLTTHFKVKGDLLLVASAWTMFGVGAPWMGNIFNWRENKRLHQFRRRDSYREMMDALDKKADQMEQESAQGGGVVVDKV